MPGPDKLVKATLTPIDLGKDKDAKIGDPITVQFNPESLTVTYSNQKAGGDQRGGAALQFVGQGSTKLSMDLWFDVSQPLPKDITRKSSDAPRQSSDVSGNDVRELTERVIAFITPEKKGGGKKVKWKAPGVSFQWGSFLFKGVMDSLTEKLEFFSEDGRPLRAMVSISLSNQEIQHLIEAKDARGDAAQRAQAPSPGTTPKTPAQDGQTVQDMAAQAGNPEGWREIAAANEIENPRILQPGQLLDMGAAQTLAPVPVARSFIAPESLTGSETPRSAESAANLIPRS